MLGDGGHLLEVTNKDLELGTVHIGQFDPDTPPVVTLNEDTKFLNFFNNPYEEGWRNSSGKFPNGDPYGRTDPWNGGYRHCVAACLLTKRFSGDGIFAIKLADLLRGETLFPDADSPSI